MTGHSVPHCNWYHLRGQVKEKFADLVPSDATLQAAARITPRGGLTCSKPMILGLELPEEARDAIMEREGLQCFFLWRRNASEDPVIYHEARGTFGVVGITYLDAAHPVPSTAIPWSPGGPKEGDELLAYMRPSSESNGFWMGRGKGKVPSADGTYSDRFGVYDGAVNNDQRSEAFWFFRSVEDWGEYFVYTRPLDATVESGHEFPVFGYE